MPLKDRMINIYLKFGCLVASGGVDILVSSICFQKSNIDWPQQPPTEKVLEFNIIFHDSTPPFFFQNIKIKLNSNVWMTLKSSVVIFQTLKPLQPQLPQWPQWPQWPQQPHFIKRITYPDGLITPCTQMTNTSPFLWNGLSKIQFFTNIWYSLCLRLLRPANVIFLKAGSWNTNVQTSWSH